MACFGSQSGRVVLVNGTKFKWTKVHEESNGMQWEFPHELEAGQKEESVIEWFEPFLGKRDCCARVQYQIETEGKYTISLCAEWKADQTQPRQLWIDRSTVPSNWVSVPPTQSTVAVQWRQQSLMMVMLSEPLAKLLQPTSDPEVDMSSVHIQPRSSSVAIAGAQSDTWMQDARETLQVLTVHELVLPGAHDAGTCAMVSPFAGPWASCQTRPISQLLRAGCRSLDLRVSDDDGTLILVHGDWRTKTSLKEALEMVRDFVAENPFEVVILDFHRFVTQSGGKEVDPQQVAGLVREVLTEEVLLPPTMHNESLCKVWQTSGRVVALCNDVDDSCFGPAVSHKWAGPHVTTAAALKTFVENNMSRQRPFWGIMAALPPHGALPIPNIGNKLEAWFQPGTDLMKHANIVYCDFFHKSILWQHCLGESLLRALRKRAFIIKLQSGKNAQTTKT